MNLFLVDFIKEEKGLALLDFLLGNSLSKFNLLKEGFTSGKAR